MNVVKLISKASECNLNQFLSCLDNDYSVLIIFGKPSQQQLAEAFQNILEEFNDISGQSTPSEYLVILRQLKILELRRAKYVALIDATEKLCMFTDIPIPQNGLDLFINDGYSISFNGNRREFMDQLLAIKQSEFAYEQSTQDELEAQLEELKANDKNVDSTSSRRNFLEQMNDIETFYKLQINYEQYSVERAGILVNRYRTMVEKQSNETSFN